jgi:HSP20 family protein
MPLVDPFGDVSRLRQQIDRLFDERGGDQKPSDGRVWRPAVDAWEDEEAVTLRLDLPGLNRDSLDVQLTAEELVIRGERKWLESEKATCIHAERPYGQFHRAFRLGLPLQNDAVEAAYQDGVLTVRLPKAETLKPRKIEVRGAPGE